MCLYRDCLHTFRPHSLLPASSGAPSPAAVLGGGVIGPSGLLPPGQCLRVQDSARTDDRQEAQLHEDSPPPLAATFGPSP